MRSEVRIVSLLGIRYSVRTTACHVHVMSSEIGYKLKFGYEGLEKSLHHGFLRFYIYPDH
jgi:hypothetical protein